MEIFKAHKQWKERPADERFTTIQALRDASKSYADHAKEASAPWNEIRVEADAGELRMVGRAGVPAFFTHWSFGQLAARVGAPASYLRTLPATLAGQNLNHGLSTRTEGSKEALLMFHQNGNLVLRAATSEAYARIWNWEIGDRLLDLQAQGWTPAMPDIRKTDADFPALYASDHDMFAFLRNADAVVAEKGNADGLKRGLIVENSEVGAGALKVTKFLYREMCGNHIIWGASEVVDVSIRHTGSAREKWGIYEAQLRKYLESSATLEEGMIAEAKRTFIADDKDGVLDKLFGLRGLGLSRKTLDEAFEVQVGEVAAGREKDSPRSVWGMVQGLTRHSQSIPYADKRTDMDRAAGKLMRIEF